MSPQPEESNRGITDKPLLHKFSSTYPKRLWSIISNNLQWKLLALFLAVLLWVGLILQDTTLTRERVFADVPLTITGSESLRRNGLIVVQGLEKENAVIRLKVDVPQQEYNDVGYSNYNPRIDLSRITEAGEQTAAVSTNSSALYGTVTSVSPEEIAIVVDRYITNYRIPVQVSILGNYPSGYYGKTPVADVSTVAVSGPESIVSRIAKIVLQYDVTGLSAHASTLQTALPLHYMDANDNELDASLLEATSGGVLLRSIILEQDLYPIKTLSLNGTALTTGSPKAGYEVKNITVSPGAVIVAGDAAALSVLDTLFLEEVVNLDDRDTSFTAEIRIEQPDNIVYMNSQTVTLVVDIGAVMDTQVYEDVPVTVGGLTDDITATIETSKVTVTLTGPALLMDVMSAARLKASVSANGLTAGTYNLPITITVNHDNADQFTYSISPQSISLTVTEN